MSRRFVGVDVQLSRGCAYAVLDERAVVTDRGWFDDAAAFSTVLESLAPYGELVVGIDAPRRTLPSPRAWGLVGGAWARVQRDNGRHAELVVKALGLANPQWTPLEGQAPPWMLLGFSLFDAVNDVATASAHEVFPSASYRMFEAAATAGEATALPTVTFSLERFVQGPKDMLDAIVAAVTVKEYVEGRGCAVGGGDGYGTIVLPRPLTATQAAHPAIWWPLASPP